jgi:hypothetical protein
MRKQRQAFRALAVLTCLAIIPLPAHATQGSAPVEITEEYYDGRVVLDQDKCFEWMFYGVRGSDEKATSGSSIGPTLKVAFDELAKMWKFRGKIGSASPADYQALPVVLKGTTEQAADWWFEQALNNAHTNIGLRALALTCPESKILLAGYSQGAMAISSSYEVLRRDSKDPILGKIRGAFLVGNPARNSSRGLLRQLTSYCSKPYRVGDLINFVREACVSQETLEYDALATRTPRSSKSFRVREFNAKNDIFADLNLRGGIASLPTAIEAHSSYNKANTKYLSSARSFAREVK